MTSTLGSLVVFVMLVGLVLAVGIAIGMIVAGRIDRRIAPPGLAGPGSPEPAAEAQPDQECIEEHDE